MREIDEVTAQNMRSYFSIKSIVEDSIFYPASGLDTSVIAYFSRQYTSFVHVDYSHTRERVENSMKHQFEALGYDLVGMRYVSRDELTPRGFAPRLALAPQTLNTYEKQQLSHGSVLKNFTASGFTTFATWAVYERNPSKLATNQQRVKRFSLLHVGGEACAVFEGLYLGNRVNPVGVAIVGPGEDKEENWTDFRNPDFRFYQAVAYNVTKNKAQMPAVLFTNQADEHTGCFWPDYTFKIGVELPQRTYSVFEKNPTV